MKRMNGVHTRIGLTFTALFEIVASTITSLSVCSLMRFKVTMVPWYVHTVSLCNCILMLRRQEPAAYCHYLRWSGEHVQFGIESSCRWSSLIYLSFPQVDAVTKTSVTLPVKERIAEGLSRAGSSNTLKVVGYNCVLGTIARCSTGAISQFCTFAVVVLVAHWFLAHTLDRKSVV